jgi:hypothetical protein
VVERGVEQVSAAAAGAPPDGEDLGCIGEVVAQRGEAGPIASTSGSSRMTFSYMWPVRS